MITADYVKGAFVSQVKLLDKMFSEKVLPAFDEPEAQAEKVAQGYWEQNMSEPWDPEGSEEDPGSIADDAQRISVDFYLTMFAMHHTVVNLFTAGVFHL